MNFLEIMRHADALLLSSGRRVQSVDYDERRGARGAYVLRLVDGTERTIDGLSRFGESAERAIRDVFFCALCDDPHPAQPTCCALIDGVTRSVCEACLRSSQESEQPVHGLLREVVFGSGPCPTPAKAEPQFDTDIRVGDLVEVISLDADAMLEANQQPNANNIAPAQRCWVGRVIRRELASEMRASRCDYVRFLNHYAWGRFRILERNGRPYVCPGPNNLAGFTDDPAPRIEMNYVAPARPRERADLVEAHPDTETWRMLDRIKAALSAIGARWATANYIGEIAQVSYRGVTSNFVVPRKATDEQIAEILRAWLPKEWLGVSATSATTETGDELPESAPEPEDTRCAWCDKPCSDSGDTLGATTHKDCARYWLALQDRLKVGGSHDCPEERESVRRFVDRQRAPQSRCYCGAQTSPKFHFNQCADCFTTENAPQSNAMTPAAEPDHPWQAWATPGAES